MKKEEEIIKCAIDGGWKYDCSPRPFHPLGDGMTCTFAGVNSQWSVWNRDDNGSSICVSHADTFLDPKFFQAIGKAKGWEQPLTPLSGVKAINRSEWLYIAENFHRINLTQSFDDAIDYLYKLIK